MAGLGAGAVRRLVRRGLLYPYLPRVYAVGHTALGPLAAELGALLWLWHDAVISHRSAGAIWRVARAAAEVSDATVIGRDAVPVPSVATYRVPGLDVRDVRICQGLPVTAPARTLIDLAGMSPLHEVEGALAEARVQRLLTDRALRDALERAPGRTGSATIRALLDDEPTLTRSEAERRLARLIGDGGLPPPETNVRVLGFEVDFVWPAVKLVVEVDGHAFHAHRAAFERDRERDQALVAAGYRVIRVTWRQLEREPLAVLARIAQALHS
jgi:very-short-patch-repair endonuclease